MPSADLRIAALEPYAAVSHTSFLEGLARHSRHELRFFTLPARSWKWRMRTASLHFAWEMEREEPFDLFLASDYLNLAELRSLLPPRHRETPSVVYFHENQVSYPLREGERRDVHHGLTHLHAILCSEAAVFNSEYHRRSFLDGLTELLRKVPDVDVEPALETARSRSEVLPVGTLLEGRAPRALVGGESPRILWNHRWEYDKDPLRFLDALSELDRRGVDFRLHLLGQRFRELPEGVEQGLSRVAHRVEVSGFLEDHGSYLETLRRSDIVCSTARHEFFGVATLEALRSGCMPLLPADLAYPELLPRLDDEDRFLYPPASPFAEALEHSLEAAREGLWMEDRARIQESTARFHWERLAPEYDELFLRAVRGTS